MEARASLTMLLFYTALLLLTNSCESAADHHQSHHRRLLQQTGASQTPSGKVMGYVVCDACLERNLTKNSILIPGTTVALTCKIGNQSPFYSVLQNTDIQGRFMVDLPSQISNSEAAARLCTAKVVKGPPGSCSTALNSELNAPLTFHSVLQGHRIFSTGPFVYSPSKALASCATEASAQEISSAQLDKQSTASAKDEKNTKNLYGAEKAPAFPSFPNFGGGSPFSFPPLTFPSVGGLPSSPASQFPVTSWFPSVPANPPPVFSQVPPLSGFPQLPAFQFPFFAPPPPGF